MLIEVKHLSKRYGNHQALSDLSFSIEKGQIYGFLGPNGAGKSTTMNIMTGCLAATDGSVTIDGFDIFEDADEAKKTHRLPAGAAAPLFGSQSKGVSDFCGAGQKGSGLPKKG